jgi:hypothetical protein
MEAAHAEEVEHALGTAGGSDGISRRQNRFRSEGPRDCFVRAFHVSSRYDSPRDVSDPAAHFVVSVHDAWPAHVREIATILKELRPRVGRAISLAATPMPMGRPWSDDPPAARELCAMVHDGVAEVLLHGLTHHRPASLSPLSILIGRHDEFATLPLEEAITRLRDGAARLRDALDLPIRGVLPPAWRAGNIPAALRDAGLEFVVGMCGVRSGPTGGDQRITLATWSWDAGKVAPLGHLLDLWGNFLSCRTTSVPCIALHPADVTRPYFRRRALSIIDRLLAAGRRPATFEQLLAARSPPPPPPPPRAG